MREGQTVVVVPEEGSDWREELTPSQVFQNIIVHGRPYSNAMCKRYGQRTFSDVEKRFHATDQMYTIDTKVMRSAGGK